jgi:hypothetical protein
LWNEISREGRNRKSHDIGHYILGPIHQLYIALHQGTDAAPTALRASLAVYFALHEPSTYPGHHSYSVTGDITHPTITGTSPSAHPPDAAVLNTITPSPSLTADHGPAQSAEVSLHDVLDATPTVEVSHHRDSPPPINVETTHSTATSLDKVTQGPTDPPPTTFPTFNSESVPHSTQAVLTFTPHSSFAPPSSNTPDPGSNADLRIAPCISSSSPSVPVHSDSLPANPQSSLSPAFRLGHVTPAQLPPTSATSISLTPPQGTSISHPDTAPSGGTAGGGHGSSAQISTNVEIPLPERSHQSAMSVPAITMDVLRHSLDTASSSGDIYHPE